jgi:hypothetical protein
MPLSPGIVTDVTNSSNFAGTLNIFLLSVDPALSGVTFAYNFTPSDKFLGSDPDDEETASELKYHSLFTFGSSIIPQFERGTDLYGTQAKFPTTITADGIYAFYPADEYKLKSVAVTCRFTNMTEAYSLTPRTSLAIAPKCAFGLNVRSSLGTIFRMDISDITDSSSKTPADGFSYVLSVNIVRPFMFRLYPGFVIFALWLIIVFELLLIFSLSFFEFRKVSWPNPKTLNPLPSHPTNPFSFVLMTHLITHAYTRTPQAEFANVAIFSALIFALPSFRNSMPLAPPFGSLCDWISFFWAEAFAVIGLFIMGCKCDISAQFFAATAI